MRGMERRFVINGIITEFIRPDGDTFHTLTHVSEFVDTYPELRASICGMLSSQIHYQSKSVSSIGSFDNLKRNVDATIDKFGKHVTLPSTISEGLREEDVWPQAMKYLKPIFLENDGNIFFLHPLFISYLESIEGIDAIIPDDESQLKYLALLDDLSKLDTYSLDLSNLDYFQKRGVNTSQLSRVSFEGICFHRFVKTLKKYY
jgi:hypothetical protein